MAGTGKGYWSITPASNATADPNVNWQEGQLAPTINNNARAMMAETAKHDLDLNGVAATSVVNTGITTYSVTLNTGVADFGNMLPFTFIPDADNEGASLINVTGQGQTALGAVNIVNYLGLNISTGDLKLGSPVNLLYDGSSFVAMGMPLISMNPNILDNPLGFIGIIQTQNDAMNGGSATIPLDGFPVNRFKSYKHAGGTVSIGADGTFNFDKPLSYFVPEYLAYAGRALTISNEEAATLHFRFGGDGAFQELATGESYTGAWPSGGTNPEYLYLESSTGEQDAWSVKGLKLEEGNYPTPFTIPNEAENKRKCALHCYIEGSKTHEFLAVPTYYTTTYMGSGRINFPFPMYETPSVIVYKHNATAHRIINAYNGNNINTDASWVATETTVSGFKLSTSNSSGYNNAEVNVLMVIGNYQFIAVTGK